MNKTVLATIAVAIVAAGGIYFFTREDNEPQQAADTTSTQNQPSTPAPSEPTSNTNADAAHLSGANSGATLDATDQTEVTINMEDFRFDPQILKIKSGTKVTWVNNGGTGHDVMPASNSPNQFQASQLLANGESYSFTFSEAGKYYYFCTPHSTEMRAIIEVVQ